MHSIKKNFSFLFPVIAFPVFVLFMAGCESREKAKEEKNKAVVRRFYEEIWNKGDMTAIDEIWAVGPVEDEKKNVTGFRTIFPDIHFTIEDEIAKGDKVAVRWTMRGTHKSEFMGIPATGKQITVEGMNFWRVAGGKLAEEWLSLDWLSLRNQLDVTSTE
jgi:predicted SnoaL-like aldol condensation-catalyzing enzyme